MKWTINRKLLGGFGVVIAILIAMVAISFSQLRSVNDSYSFLLQDKAQKAVDIKDLQVAVKQEMSSLRGYLLLGTDQALQEYTQSREDFKNKYNNLQSRFKIAEAKKMLSDLNSIEDEYNQLSEQVIELQKQKKTEEANLLMTSKGKDIVTRINEQSKKLSDYQNDILDKGNKETSDTVKHTMNVLIIIGIIAVIISITIAWFIGRLISKPLIAIAHSTSRVSDGDLTVEPIQVKNKDEIGDLAQSFNLMTDNLRSLIHKVNNNAVQVASSAEELTASAEQTSLATNQIATSIHEISSGAELQGQGAMESSSAMNEMTVGIQQVAESSAQVSELSSDTLKEANNGHDSLKKVISQMNTITDVVDDSARVVKNLGSHSEEIGHIIEVITSIADQTNLLALNAAIESARAGEHGKGFAVVAAEVRKLAEQSKQSADQIAQLISKIQNDTARAVDVMTQGTHEVQVGMTVVHEAETGFKEIVKLIEQVSSKIEESTAISEEMSAGAEQINATMEDIAQIAQTSATNTQHVAAASEEQLASMEEISSSALALSKMAEELQEHVNQFKI